MENKITIENEIIINKLSRIEKYIIGLKEIFNIEELAEYTGFRQSYIYKLVHLGSIPYYKPSGKKLFFSRKEIDEWLLKNRYQTDEEIEKEAVNYVYKK